MPYNSTNKKITAPLSVGDVAQCLSHFSNDVGTLCTSNKINKWAKHKPTIYPTISGAKMSSGNFEQYQAVDGSCGLNFDHAKATSLQGVMRKVTGADPVPSGKNLYEWEYRPPRGGLASPYRLTDFNGYYHEAQKPFVGVAEGLHYIEQVEEEGSGGGGGEDTGGDPGATTHRYVLPLQVEMTQNGNDGEIGLGDLYYDTSHKLSDFGQIGVVLVRGSESVYAVGNVSGEMEVRIPDMAGRTGVWKCSVFLSDGDGARNLILPVRPVDIIIRMQGYGVELYVDAEIERVNNKWMLNWHIAGENWQAQAMTIGTMDMFMQIDENNTLMQWRGVAVNLTIPARQGTIPGESQASGSMEITDSRFDPEDAYFFRVTLGNGSHYEGAIGIAQDSELD